MKVRVVLFGSVVGLFALAGCMEKTTWYQAGVTPQKLNSDLTDCQVAAAQRVPVSSQLGQTPTYTTPVQTQCYRVGYSVSCTQTGGQVYGGNVYSYDANGGLRAKVVQQCMNRLGYQLVTIRQCEDKDLKGGIKTYSVLPQMTPQSCYIDTSTGMKLVNP